MSMPMKVFMEAIFPEETAAQKEGRCPFCKKDVDEDGFRDQLSQDEFKISGLCQDCQDEIFMV